MLKIVKQILQKIGENLDILEEETVGKETIVNSSTTSSKTAGMVNHVASFNKEDVGLVILLKLQHLSILLAKEENFVTAHLEHNAEICHNVHCYIITWIFHTFHRVEILQVCWKGMQETQ